MKQKTTLFKTILAATMMLGGASSAWADVPTKVSVKTIWEFSSQTVGDLTENKNINGLWLRAGSGGKIEFQNLKRSGNFSDGSTWTTITNNASGVSAYIPNNGNLTPTSSYFTSYDAADGNRTRRCAALQTTVKGNFYLALYVNTSNTGEVNLYKVGSTEQSVASASNVAGGATDFTGAGNTATIKYHGEPGLYVLGSKNIGFHLCYMKFVPTYNIQISANSGGSITSVLNGTTDIKTDAIGNDGAICETESSITVTATPNSGFVFTKWTNAKGTTVSTNAEYNFSLDNDVELTAHFAKSISAVDNLGYTFSSTLPLDFTGTSVRAYIATYDSERDVMRLTQVNKVPANTGVLIFSDSEMTNQSIPVCATTPDNVDNNCLKPVSSAMTLSAAPEGYENYVLAIDIEEGKAVFQLVSGTSASMTAGQAYLQIPKRTGEGARSLRIVFDDETTGVADVRSKMSEVRGEYYNLSGQRVEKPAKGLYIVNGKKVIVK